MVGVQGKVVCQRFATGDRVQVLNAGYLSM